MADLVLGLAKSSVEGTISMVKAAMEEEEKVQKNLRRDLVLISDEFEMMRSFIKVAAGEQQEEGGWGPGRAANDMTTTLVRQVRKVAIDAEDAIESVIYLDRSRWWHRLRLRSFFFMPPARPLASLNKVVADVEMVKTRVQAMGQRNKRYNCIAPDFGSKKLAAVDKEQLKSPGRYYYTLEKFRDASKVKQGDGTPDSLTKLIKLKYDDGHLPRVVSVWSSGEDGMTMTMTAAAAIIKEAYENPEIRRKFGRAWVSLPDPFNRREFFERLLLSCQSTSRRRGTSTTVKEVWEMLEDQLVNKLIDNLSSKRYLVVLEGLSRDAWKIVMEYLSNWNRRGCIIVHTQSIGTASLCVGHPSQALELRRFSNEHSVFALYKEDGQKHKTERVGRQTDLGRLHFELAVEQKRTVMSVWGIAGVGKSSMVKNWIGVRQKHFDKYGWVNASHPINLKDLSWRLLMDLQPDEFLDPEHHGTLDPIKICREILCTHRCLVVIDGLQFTREWDLIKDALATGNSGSLIIVITNEKSVASKCANRVIMFNVKSLQYEEACNLFKQKVYRNVPAAVVEEKEVVGSFSREIVAKCGGIPKVIIAVADILNKLITSKKENIESLGLRCMKLRDQFMLEMEKKTALPDLFAWVQSYFRNCQDFLKPCIFYLSIFPLRHIIRRRRLVRRWVAEGYSRASKDHTAEEKAEEFMSTLIELSMIHPVEVTTSMVYFGAGMHLCQVNCFFREYTMSVSMEENHVFELKGHCKMSVQRMGQHLTIQSDWDRDKNVFDGSIDVSRLRSLTVFGEWMPFFVSEKMAVLRVLDLEGTSGVKDEELKQILRLLPPLLRFLSLRGCREITRLPDSLRHLRQLQTLDVRDTSVAALPSSITKLQKLEYVRAGPTISYNGDRGKIEIPPPHIPSRSCTSSVCSLVSWHQPRHAYIAGGVEVPGGIGKLSALHTLGVVHISSRGADGEAAMEDLKKLTQLHKLGVCGVNQKNNKKLCSTILCHSHLQSLSVQLDENSQAGCLDAIPEPPESLRSLKLYGLVGELPVWTKGLVNLKKLKLQMTAILPQVEIDVLGTLPKLQTLCLWLNEFQDGKLQFGSGFTELFVLEISCNPSSNHVSFQGRETMASLEVLKVHCCGVLQLQFSGLDGCEELTEVRLSGTYDSALKQVLQSQLAPHPRIPVLKEWDIDLSEWKTVH